MRRLAAAAIAMSLGTAGALALPLSAAAAPCVVSDAADTNTAGTLRFALNQAALGNCDGLITFTINAVPQGATPLPDIVNDLTITGPGPAGLTINGVGVGTGVLNVTGGTVTITGLTVDSTLAGTHGISASGGTVVLDQIVASTLPGSGVSVIDANLTATNLTANGNDQGGVNASSNVVRTLTLRDVVANANLSVGVSAVWEGPTEFTRVTAHDNDSVGIGASISGTFTGADLAANDNANAGIGITNEGGSSGTLDGANASGNVVGGIHISALSGSTFDAWNLSATSNEYAGIVVNALGSGATTRVYDSVAADNEGHGFRMDPDDGVAEVHSSESLRNGDLTGACACEGSGVVVGPHGDATALIDGMMIADNEAYNGGGIRMDSPPSAQLTVLNTQILRNDALNDPEEPNSGRGGGFYGDTISNAGSITISDSTIAENTAAVSGGGIALDNLGLLNGSSVESAGFGMIRSTVADNVVTSDAGVGGGLSIVGYGEGEDGAPIAAIDSSTFEGNSASRGGGIYVEQSVLTAALIDIVNTTVSEQADGGAAWFEALGEDQLSEIRLRHSTVADNVNELNDGGVSLNGGTLVLDHTVITGSSGADLIRYSGSTLTANWNIVTTPEASTVVALPVAQHNRIGIDPKLGALADNGGPTRTNLPLTGSPAIDSGDPAFVAPPGVDQRGLPRVVRVIDIGAVEVAPALAATGTELNPVVGLGALVLLVAGAAFAATPIVARRRAG